MRDVNYLEVAVHRGPISGLVTNSDGTRLMVANYGDDSVSVIDLGSYQVVETIDGLDEPFALAMSAAGADRVYVSTVSPGYDSIQVVDVPTGTVTATHPLALSVTDLAASPDGDRLYASRYGVRGPDVAVLDTATGRIDEIALPNRPGTTTECVRVGPGGDDRLYVATNGPAGGQLVVIGTRPGSDERRVSWRPRSAAARRGAGVIATVEIGLPIRDVALSPDGASAYVASCAPELGAVIDVVDTRTAKIVGTSKIGELGMLTRMTLSRDGERAYLVSDEGITVLCMLTHDVIGAVGIADQPSCVIESLDARRLYIADYSGKVTVAPAPAAADLERAPA